MPRFPPMDIAIRLAQPDLIDPTASRNLAFGPSGVPLLAILNGRGARFEGGADEPDLSLKWVPEGLAEYRSERSTFRLSGTTQLLLNRGQPYRMRMLGASESFVVFFPKLLADRAWQAHSGTGDAFPEVPAIAARGGGAIEAHLGALRREVRCEMPDAERLKEHAFAVLAELAGTAQIRRRQFANVPALKSSTRAELLRRLVRAETYLLEAGARATLDGAARAAALSPFHLIRMFRAVFGATPLAFAAGQRLDRAHDTLLKSGAAIERVAGEAGYNSRTAFDRAFVKRFGRTPGAVRRA
jgi:AraC family transcriptional regulator